MKQIYKKIYCFVDETGQDTLGKFFLVSVVLQENENLEKFEKSLLEIETITGKKKLKWKLTNNDTKIKYLEAVFSLSLIAKSLFYSVYDEGVKYSELTAYSLAKAILNRYKREEIIATVIIDGLNDKEREIVQKGLKSLDIHYNKVRGMKDEQSVFLRLADAVAGFMRDFFQKEKYAVEIMKEIKGKSAPIEV